MDNRTKYEQEVEFLSVEELKDILINRHLHNGWEITFARKELEKRGIELTIEEKIKIDTNKNKIIEEAKRNTIPLNHINWYKYDNFDLKEINLEFGHISFFTRIKKELIINIVIFTLILLVALLTSDSEMVTITLLLLGSLFLVTIFMNLIISIYQNKNHLIKLQANAFGITLKYTQWNSILDLYSTWNDIEIKKRISISMRDPLLILIFKNRDGKSIKIYSEYDIELDRNSLDKLIYNLKILKHSNR